MARLPPVLLSLLSLLSVGNAAEPPAVRNTVFSKSGQFVIAGKSLPPTRAVVYGVDTNWNQLVPVGRQPASGSVPANPPETDPAENPVINLAPSFLAASAERIKQAIWEKLDLTEHHRGKVYVTLLQPTDPPQDILVMHMRNNRGGVWDYKLELPEEIRSDYLLRALTHVILLEAANRHGQARLAEVPFWLREGMVAHLQATVMKSVFFDQDKRISFTARLNDEIAVLKREINKETLFDLEQISWPGTLPPGPATERVYRLTSHGMVAELLQLHDGGRCLGNMLRLLSGYENWQFAFLQAFEPHFRTLLDFEKWWAVASMDLSSGEHKRFQPIDEDLIFRTELELARWQRVISMYLGDRGANREWPFRDCYLRLDQILHVPVEWQKGVEEDVSREEIAVRDIINNMEFSLQVPVIEQRIAQLFGLQLHSPPEFAGLVRDYRFILEKYLVEREASYAVNSFKMNGSISPILAARKTLEKLNELDGRRDEMSDRLLEADPIVPDRVASTKPID